FAAVKQAGIGRKLVKLGEQPALVTIEEGIDLTLRKAFLKKEARADLARMATMHAATIRAPIRSISMKDTRSRWGSCS
ncbi:YgjP-like metallopeptidase domain-containing protein, partial [Rhizobium johnstonii]